MDFESDQILQMTRKDMERYMRKSEHAEVLWGMAPIIINTVPYIH